MVGGYNENRRKSRGISIHIDSAKQDLVCKIMEKLGLTEGMSLLDIAKV